MNNYISPQQLCFGHVVCGFCATVHCEPCQAGNRAALSRPHGAPQFACTLHDQGKADFLNYIFANSNPICLKCNISRTFEHFSLCHTAVCLQRRNSRLHIRYWISDASSLNEKIFVTARQKSEGIRGYCKDF